MAHEETPPPFKSSSPGTPSQRESAPVARTRVCAWKEEALVVMTNGRADTSIESAISSSKTVWYLSACHVDAAEPDGASSAGLRQGGGHKERACRFISLMMSPPDASGIPG